MPPLANLPDLSRPPVVLVVDDEPKNLQLVLSLLTQRDYDTVMAANGIEAIESAKAEKPDLILLDVMMPGQDGFAVCRALKQDPATREIPVIFVTAKTEAHDLAEGFAAGGVDYLTKPFRSTELFARVQTHVQLKRAKEEVVRLQRQQARLFAQAASDLRAPFWQLSAFCRMLTDGRADSLRRADLLEFARQLERDATAGSQLLESLYKLSSLQFSDLEIFPQPLAPRPLVAEIIGGLQALAAGKRQTIDNRIPGDTSVVADAAVFTTIVRSLLHNAIKYSNEGGTIAIEAEAHGPRHVAMRVIDTGIGLSAEELAVLFDLEKRAVRSGTAGEGGSGLSLIVAQQFAARSGGELTLTSSPGLGTTAQLTLPTTETEQGKF